MSPRNRWSTYLRWFLVVGVVFFGVYPLCNWAASFRTRTWGLFFPAELAIPFLPGFLWVYLSMYLLFLTPPLLLDAEGLDRLGRRLVAGTWTAGLVFLLAPTRLGFTREVPSDPTLAAIYAQIFSLDLPHNMVPSLHVVYSGLFLMAYAKDGPRRVPQGVWWAWLGAICLSTLFVHQHHVLDVATGLGWAIVINRPSLAEASHA